jgi:predicted amidohydrolase
MALSTKPPLRVALAQIRCPWADPEASLERVAHWAGCARDRGAGLVVFPELTVGGICKDERLASVAEDLDGPSVTAVRALARRLDLAVGFGFSERTGGRPHNAYAVVAPDGTVAGVYRKNHLPELERPFWQAHAARPVFPVRGWPVAVATCWDNKYPDLLEHYAREGAKIVLMPHAWDADVLDDEGRVFDYHSMEEIVAYRRRRGVLRFKTHDQMRDDFLAYVPALARGGRFFALFVNQSGRPHECLEFVGPSFVVDPAGRVRAETRDGGEQLVVADLDLAPVHGGN